MPSYSGSVTILENPGVFITESNPAPSSGYKGEEPGKASGGLSSLDIRRWEPFSSPVITRGGVPDELWLPSALDHSKASILCTFNWTHQGVGILGN